MKKLISLLLCVVMLVSVLAACGADEEVVVETTEEVVETVETVETAEPGIYDGVEMVYWSGQVDGTPAAEVLKELAAEFKAETGCVINIVFKGNERRKMMPTALESGEDIDIFDSAGFYELRTFDPAWIMDLTPYYEESGYADKTYGVMIRDLEANSPEGGLPGVVKGPGLNGLWYDKAAVAAAGITEMPTTFDEFEAMFDAILETGVAPLSLDSAYLAGFFGTVLQRHCGQEVVAEMSMNGGWSENEGAVAAAQRMIDWKAKGYFVDGAPDVFPTSQNKIALGLSAMVNCGVWVSNEIETAMGVDLDWGFTKFPILDVTIDANVDSAYSGYIHVNETCDNPDAAWDWLMKIVTGDGDKRWTDAAQCPPADKTNEALPEFTDTVAYLDSVEVCLDVNCAVANADMKAALTDVMVQIFEGKFATGLEAMQAMDALYN